MTKTIPLSQGKVALVDDQDFEWLSQFRWCYWGTYAMRYERNREKSDQQAKRRPIQMHRAILRKMHPRRIDGLMSDHISGDRLDNRRCNLRVCTPVQNSQNRIGKRKSYTAYKGVFPVNADYRGIRRRSKTRKPWVTVIVVNGEIKRFGPFVSDTEAALAYNTEALEHFGEFAQLNEMAEAIRESG